MNGLSDNHRFYLQRQFGVTPADLIAQGMEAQVYRYDTRHVLKLYTGTTSLVRLQTLQQFYARLEASSIGYALPQIDIVLEEQGAIIALERLLPGRPMSDLLPHLDRRQLDRYMRAYLAAALELRHVHVGCPLDRYKLFDEENISSGAYGDWHQFLSRLLTSRLAGVTPFLASDVADFDAKVRHLQSVLAQPYTDGHALIHGDFFPGNLLVDAEGKITALLDFGLWTMIGDYLFDIATRWVFFDMYDELRANLRERYFAIVLDTLGEQVRGDLYRYILLYSIVGANAYSATCEDGHYQWCVANLNNAVYWNAIQ